MARLKVKKYWSKPTQVEAIQVTHQNMAEVSRWCSGQIKTVKDENTSQVRKFIKVKVWRAQSDKLTQAFVGDWVIRRGTNFKVYSEQAFKNSYTDGAAIPMVPTDPNVSEAVFDGLVKERTTPRRTRVQVGEHIETISTPAQGVPMRGVESDLPIGVPLSGPSYGFPEGSVVMFGQNPAPRPSNPSTANLNAREFAVRSLAEIGNSAQQRAVIEPTGFERPASE